MPSPVRLPPGRGAVGAPRVVEPMNVSTKRARASGSSGKSLRERRGRLFEQLRKRQVVGSAREIEDCRPSRTCKSCRPDRGAARYPPPRRLDAQARHAHEDGLVGRRAEEVHAQRRDARAARGSSPGSATVVEHAVGARPVCRGTGSLRRDFTTSTASFASQKSRSGVRRAGVVEAALERRPVTRGLVEVAGQTLPMPGPEQRTDRLEPTRRSVDVADPEGRRIARDRIRQVHDHRSILGEAEPRPNRAADRSPRPDPAPARRRPCTGARWPPEPPSASPRLTARPEVVEASGRARSGCCPRRDRSAPALAAPD